jgi:hypothetical protein
VVPCTGQERVTEFKNREQCGEREENREAQIRSSGQPCDGAKLGGNRGQQGDELGALASAVPPQGLIAAHQPVTTAGVALLLSYEEEGSTSITGMAFYYIWV